MRGKNGKYILYHNKKYIKKKFKIKITNFSLFFSHSVSFNVIILFYLNSVLNSVFLSLFVCFSVRIYQV